MSQRQTNDSSDRRAHPSPHISHCPYEADLGGTESDIRSSLYIDLLSQANGMNGRMAFWPWPVIG